MHFKNSLETNRGNCLKTNVFFEKLHLGRIVALIAIYWPIFETHVAYQRVDHRVGVHICRSQLKCEYSDPLNMKKSLGTYRCTQEPWVHRCVPGGN